MFTRVDVCFSVMSSAGLIKDPKTEYEVMKKIFTTSRTSVENKEKVVSKSRQEVTYSCEDRLKKVLKEFRNPNSDSFDGIPDSVAKALEQFRNKDYVEEPSKTEEESKRFVNKRRIVAVPNEAVSGYISGNFNHVNMVNVRKGEDKINVGEIDKLRPRLNHVANEAILDLNMCKGSGWRNHPFEDQVPDVLSVKSHGNSYSDVYGQTIAEHDYNKAVEYLVGNVTRRHKLNNKDFSNLNPKITEALKAFIDRMFWMPLSNKAKCDNETLFGTDYSRHIFYHSGYDKDSEETLDLWYKDNTNTLSAVRPLFVNDYLTRFTSYGAEEISRYDNSHLINKRPYHPVDELDRFTKIPASRFLIDKIEKLLAGKIMVVEHKRINTFVNSRDDNCPILDYYLSKGYEIVEDDGSEDYIKNAIFKSFKKNILKDGVIDYDSSKDRGFYSETQYKAYRRERNGQMTQTYNKSINIVRTIVIDIKKSLLEDQDVVYDRTSDLLFGRVWDGIDFDSYNHPSVALNNETRSDSATFKFNYYFSSYPEPCNLYVNTHGIVTKITPEYNIMKKSGLYCIRVDSSGRVKEKEITPQEYSKYGVFYTKDQAETFNSLTTEVLINHELHNALTKTSLDNRLHESRMREIDRIERLKEKEHEYKVGELGLKLDEHEYKHQALAIASVEKEREHEYKLKEMMLKLEELGIKREIIKREIDGLGRKEAIDWLKTATTIIPLVSKLVI